MAIAIILFYIFIAVFAIQLIYYLCFSVLAFGKIVAKTTNINLPISVLICAKNEAENLQKFLPSVLNQEYKNFEIVLINDASSDDTLEVMETFADKHPQIKIVNVENNEAFWGNKKYALTLGIKAAKNEHLLFTNAYCEPLSKNWITEMASQFSNKKSIVLGYGKYRKKSTLVNAFVRYETLLTAIQYFSYAKLGSPYMAVGRNLAYTKSEFFKVKGFINHMDIRSGDDDLFIQDAANSKNTTFTIHNDSFTISEAPKNFKEWFNQKRRHVSTSKHYKFTHKFFLRLFFLSKLLFLVLLFYAFFSVDFILLLPFILAYYILMFLVVGFSAKKLKETSLLPFLPFLDLGLVLFLFTIFIANTISKPVH